MCKNYKLVQNDSTTRFLHYAESNELNVEDQRGEQWLCMRGKVGVRVEAVLVKGNHS